MPLYPETKRELPPTAGLPLCAADFFRNPPVPLSKGLADRLGIPEPVITCSGTAAFILTLTVLNKREPRRGKVILPAYTCPIMALAVRLVPGLEIVLCDLLPGGINLDPDHLARLCDKETLAVTVTHLGGRVADADTAVAIANASGAFVIEDAAQAMGARQNGVSAGLAGDVGFFSLAAGKGLTMYEGGVLFSRREDLMRELRDAERDLLRGSIRWNTRRCLELMGYAFFYHPSRLRHVYGNALRRFLEQRDEISAVGDAFSMDDIPLHRPDTLRCRVAANALSRLPAFLDQGKARAGERLAFLKSAAPHIQVLKDPPGVEGVWPFFMLLLPDKASRDTALERLWRTGVGVTKLFVHALPDYAYLSSVPMRADGVDHARDLAARMLTITNTPWLDEDAFTAIVKRLPGVAGP